MAAQRVAVITGGASGIGLAIVERLAMNGDRVVICDINDEAAETSRIRLAPLGEVHYRHLDVTDEAAVEDVFAELAATFGSLDILVNNAGIAARAPLESFQTSDWRRVFDVNLLGSFFCLRAAGRIMLRQGGGAVINVASIAWARGCPGRAAYAASKAALVSLTQTAAVEWAERGVRVNAVAPGYVETDLLRSAVASGALDELEILDRIPARRLATPAQIADAVAFLASPQAAYINGHVLVIDGGFLADYGVTVRERR
jgi:NAD(P)-dependent dehydrogenase (short-subunit alcohol dehydrogenase family)